MLLESLFPHLPTGRDLMFIIVGILGAIMLIYSQFIEAENRRDLIRAVGALSLFVYAVSIWNLVFMAAMMGFFLAALTEFIEIYLGFHKHTPGDIKEYIKKYKRIPEPKQD